MTAMTAIKISPENFSLITTHADLSWRDLKEMYEDSVLQTETRYIIPEYSSEKDAYQGWANVREDVLSDLFDYDHDKIATQFVEITRK